jgi:hypothetical protein
MYRKFSLEKKYKPFANDLLEKTVSKNVKKIKKPFANDCLTKIVSKKNRNTLC